jgi:hypothetical protein
MSRKSAAARLAVAGLLLALTLAPGGTGCTPSDEAAPGAVSWGAGKLTKNYAVDCESAWAAVRAAAENLRFKIDRERHDEISGRVDAETADGLPVLLEVNRISYGVTRIGVRVGFIGSRPAADRVVAEIDKRLKK